MTEYIPERPAPPPVEVPPPAAAAPPPVEVPAPVINVGGTSKRQPFPVELWGQRYMLRPPKAALSLKLAIRSRTSGKDDPGLMLETVDEWLDKAFGKTVADQLRARMDDDNDDLDFDHLMELMEKVTVHVSGNPTGSSTGSPQPR